MEVWKLPFEIVDQFGLEMPTGARILKVECQKGQPCMWFVCNPDKPKVIRYFRVYGTGHPITGFELLDHVGTFQQPPFVWHLFEVQPCND